MVRMNPSTEALLPREEAFLDGAIHGSVPAIGAAVTFFALPV